MSRTLVIAVVVLVALAATAFGLQSINSEVPVQPVEQPIANEALAG